MNNIEKYLKHFKTITKHKFYVMKFCFKCGKYKRGLLHDLSKFGPTEFFSSAKYFQGTSSPIDAEKREKGYSLAWQHHKGHNPHHWEYWIDNIGTYKNTACKIPYDYVIDNDIEIKYQYINRIMGDRIEHTIQIAKIGKIIFSYLNDSNHQVMGFGNKELQAINKKCKEMGWI